MNIFKIEENIKFKKNQEKKSEFVNKKFHLEMVSTNDEPYDLDRMINIQILFQRMLPKMPREYILRQILDPRQCNCVLYENDHDILGAVCFRPMYDRSFVEIVFFAVNLDRHIKGYGSFLMNCFKEMIKQQWNNWSIHPSGFMNKNILVTDLNMLIHSDIQATLAANSQLSSENLYILTYADNSAIGFFRKQGFSAAVVSRKWQTYIKDYDGGTLMECKVYKDINYCDQEAFIINLNNMVMEKMREINQYHILMRHNDSQLVNLTTNLNHQTKDGFLKNFLDFFIYKLYSDPSSWPFLEPISEKDVPEYHKIIKYPMDLSTIKKKHINKKYRIFEEFEADVMLMINNCYTFNNKHTQYYKCAENIEKMFKKLYDIYKSIIDKFV